MSKKFVGFWNVSVILTYIELCIAVGSICAAADGKVWPAVIGLALCGLCDMFDGKIARATKRTKDAEVFGIQMINVLTGFKYIGEQIAHLEAEGHPERFIFGFEESYGYLAGGYVRDKDAVVASMLICEMAAWYKGQGKNLGEALDDLYAQYGFYFNKVDSYTFPGSDGMAKMAALMETLRTELPIAIAGRPVTGHTDYEAGKRYEDGEGETPTGLPASNVIPAGERGQPGGPAQRH